LADDIKELLAEAEERTKGNSALYLTIALNYGGQAEIVRACRSLAVEVAAGKLRPEDITEEVFAGRLETAGIPDPDLLIRTSGEQRLSNFLLWQSAYTELVFMDTLWPDFSKESLIEAIEDYRSRERRYGASSG
jgi:undecaprenyl diphosphate synthase